MKALRRFTNHFKIGKPLTLDVDNNAVVDGRTIFISSRREPDGRLLKSGANQRKLGSRVTKGKWKGMPIFSLTLEERATCPRSCEHWHNCYGNHMPFAKRYKHGDALIEGLEKELQKLNEAHKNGFVVRLHILGDFYDVHYVMSWGRWMQRFEHLHVFGYTGRLKYNKIGMALEDVRKAFPERWWIRYSHQDKDDWLSTGESGIICPVQTGQTDCCGTCGLCWTAEKPIRFLVH